MRGTGHGILTLPVSVGSKSVLLQIGRRIASQGLLGLAGKIRAGHMVLPLKLHEFSANKAQSSDGKKFCPTTGARRKFFQYGLSTANPRIYLYTSQSYGIPVM